VILRPQRRGLSVGTSAGQEHCRSEAGKLVRLGTVTAAPSSEDPVDPSALNSTN